jgi:hypothetical protein
MVALSVASGCIPDWGPSDPGYRADVWNRTSGDVVVQLLPIDSGQCFLIAPGQVVNVEGGIGDSLSTLRIWRADADRPEQVIPKGSHELFVVSDASTQEIELRFVNDADGTARYAHPELPDIDGEPLAPISIRDGRICPEQL